MQLRPLAVADLDLIDEIDGTVSSEKFLFVERQADAFPMTFRVEQREHVGGPKVEANPIGDELRFTLKQIAQTIEDGIAVVAEHDAVPIGVAVAMPTPDNAVVELLDVRVDYDRRRDGLASALVFQVINYARERDARAVRAVVRSSNGPAAALLAKLGFELAGLDTFRESNHDLVKEQTSLVWYLPLGLTGPPKRARPRPGSFAMDQEAFFTSPIEGLYTLRDMAARAGVPLERMIALVERERLSPTKRRGVVRLWDDAAFALVQRTLSRRQASS